MICKMVNPYAVSVWLLEKPESLFSFNENLKFTDFQAVDSKLLIMKPKRAVL